MKRNKLDEAFSKLPTAEKVAILRSMRAKPIEHKFNHTTPSTHVKFGYYSDPHVGHKKFSERLWMDMLSHFKREGIKTIYSPGDNLEGMSGRPGHVYELAQIGATAQIEYASALFQKGKEFQFYIIDGNHDQWFKEKNSAGLVSGKELERRNPNVHFLGEWEADIVLGKDVVMKLFHANDGTAYADSYKMQKLIESFTGGEKPNIILSGHYHKQVAIFRRNVFGFECGTLCGQSGFMRGKKIPAHMGFGIIELWIAQSGGIARLRHEFVPFFEK